jgi:hypothetical protein
MTQWVEGDAPEAEGEAPGMPTGQRRRKSLTIDLSASLHRRFKLARIEADRTIAEEVFALIERRTEEMEVATAMERFRAVARERGMVVGELLGHALDAFVREQEER